MRLEEIGKKEFLGKGGIAKCYTLEDGNVLKLFNHPRRVCEIERFKYFLEYANDSFLFPFEFIYDSEKIYGYITEKAPGVTLKQAFPTSNLLEMSKHSYKLEKDINFVSRGGILLYDMHDENVLYDGNKYSVIDPDENGRSSDLGSVFDSNHFIHRILISNLFLENLSKIKRTKVIKDKVTKYKYMSMKPSEMIVQVKDDMEKYYKENVDTIEDVINIVKR